MNVPGGSECTFGGECWLRQVNVAAGKWKASAEASGSAKSVGNGATVTVPVTCVARERIVARLRE